MLDGDRQMLIVNAHCGAAQTLQDAGYQLQALIDEMRCPHVRMRPRISLDGNQWCALYGENLQDGVAGFGDSPHAAMLNFDRNWHEAFPAPTGAPS